MCNVVRKSHRIRKDNYTLLSVNGSYGNNFNYNVWPVKQLVYSLIPSLWPNEGEQIHISFEKMDNAGIWSDQETWLIYKHEHIRNICSICYKVKGESVQYLNHANHFLLHIILRCFLAPIKILHIELCLKYMADRHICLH